MTFLPIDHFKSYMLDLFKGLLFFIRHVCVCCCCQCGVRREQLLPRQHLMGIPINNKQCMHVGRKQICENAILKENNSNKTQSKPCP